ncbi:hypothetical protein N7510_003763 [Penicillium lagena]|uniref:uncharacterized protein n=1 Tax=Penicillium lagena TaxID=94218 RepID=UPI00254011C4|nr:uncharacterized protein N7510_003763 [Penicillium lagena]KAJ5619779.1 hypothetical protein N7510_003763 [Penicillium lagena]
MGVVWVFGLLTAVAADDLCRKADRLTSGLNWSPAPHCVVRIIAAPRNSRHLKTNYIRIVIGRRQSCISVPSHPDSITEISKLLSGFYVGMNFSDIEL